MKLNTTGVIQLSILTLTLFLNTACFGLFGTEAKPQTAQQIMPTTSVAKPSLTNTIPAECSDELGASSACQKKPIKPQELKAKKVVTKTGGEVHKLTSIQGQKITVVERSNGYVFPELKNKIVILEMFGKNCSHCIKEMPIMNKLRQQYRNNLEIVAVQVEGKMSPMQANALIRRHAITYPLIPGSTATNLQYHIQNTYGWTGILPFIMVIKNGVTEFTYKGQVTYNELNNDIRSLL